MHGYTLHTTTNVMHYITLHDGFKETIISLWKRNIYTEINFDLFLTRWIEKMLHSLGFKIFTYIYWAMFTPVYKEYC